MPTTIAVWLAASGCETNRESRHSNTDADLAVVASAYVVDEFGLPVAGATVLAGYGTQDSAVTDSTGRAEVKFNNGYNSVHVTAPGRMETLAVFNAPADLAFDQTPFLSVTGPSGTDNYCYNSLVDDDPDEIGKAGGFIRIYKSLNQNIFFTEEDFLQIQYATSGLNIDPGNIDLATEESAGATYIDIWNTDPNVKFSAGQNRADIGFIYPNSGGLKISLNGQSFTETGLQNCFNGQIQMFYFNSD